MKVEMPLPEDEKTTLTKKIKTNTLTSLHNNTNKIHINKPEVKEINTNNTGPKKTKHTHQLPKHSQIYNNTI